ncbi:MAG: hypothetical protein IT160_09235 [Bryobacterales bacterium]|nr:hypothetical protein [Bryobacterales bacterium]
MTLTPLAISWIILAVVVLALAIYRSVLAGKGDETVHISDLETSMIAQQAATAGRLERIDRIGKTLTVVALLYGMALAGAWIYRVWVESGTVGLNG